ncbi:MULTISPECIES: glycosyltransferase family 2 protein [Mesonia]|uniref:Poly-beta-1,6-N-acetyl-D-glucosamine synthase n=1 Tax=Mesonia oceanica TaxID=2687242 RepID=A0AC61Y6J8_9FLAO|nr:MULTISPECIES: glycosyltransferase family 2 protein [Mesonia]MAN28911.1 glycosyl transferase family 2 [Mesonia sp.]MAQ42692.1 glycosyl transferase family 2 [Mesonia sp.]MBJ99229.1 glycosyl transferase family 2 [Flavobacteriaceae bacterium]VVU99772.1 Poly-beta-1,6-N-acetyl-D-glucosamine synthase [Mesonia oceanica]|tara:strand:+ start:57900 stop:58748 length:849 start_codon:yes stop_codon:yes gene_type:complete
MKFYIIIPAHNEADCIEKTLQSLVSQTLLPKKVLVVNDHSTDETSKIVEKFSAEFPFIELFNNISSSQHLPGSKIINAFYKGFQQVDENYDAICKYDADLIFPKNYLERLAEEFQQDKNLGMVGGFCYIYKEGDWRLESLTNKDHIRGALKAYRKECFKAIDGLKPSMGWDTVDELLCLYHGWTIKTLPDLKVKHLRPTGNTYNKAAKFKQGEAFYKLGYGFPITFIASLKLAMRKKQPQLLKDYLQGYWKAKQKKLPSLVTPEEGKWIRKYRWKKMREKFL